MDYYGNFVDSFKKLVKENKLALILGALVTAKFFVFYTLMEVNSNFAMIVVVSVVLTGMLFCIPKRKWTAGIVYFILSWLMFADVTYYSFFGKYLSVKMIGAVEVVDEITDSIAEVIQPVNFICVLDALIILAVLLAKLAFRSNRQKREDAAASKKESWQQFGMRFGAFALVIAIILCTSPISAFSKAVRNQEFYNFHIYDCFDSLHEERAGSGNLAAFTDSYRDENDGPLFGIAEGRNVVFIQLESFMNFVIGREYNGQVLTPNLNNMIEQGDTIYFDHFYQQIGSGNTSDAEFAANNSVYGTVLTYTNSVYGSSNYFRGLPVLLKEQGYSTQVFHAYEDKTFWSRESAYPNLGFDRYYGGLIPDGGDYDMTEWIGWGLSDTEFLYQTSIKMKEDLDNGQPYYAFINTLSNHHPFKMLDYYEFIELGDELKDTLVGNYLQSVSYVDYALGQFFQLLRANDMYDNTIFVIYGDHAGITHSDENDALMEQLLGTDEYFDSVLLNVPCFIHIPGVDTGIYEPVNKTGGHLDILPTLAYLLGWEDLDTIYFGHNLLSPGEGFAAEQTFVKRGSFIKGDVMYEIALDGIFDHGRAWNVDTLKAVSLDGLYEYYEKGMDIIQSSEYLLKTDGLRQVYLNGASLDSIGAATEARTAYPDEVVIAGYPDQSLVGTGTIEALNASYDAGYRYIRLSTTRNEGEEIVYTADAEGNPVIDHNDVISWFMEHQDTIIVPDIVGECEWSLDNLRYFFGKQSDEGALVGRAMLLYANRTNELTGRYDIFLDASNSGADAETLRNFINVNDVWAVVIDEDDMSGEIGTLKDAGCELYIKHANGMIECQHVLGDMSEAAEEQVITGLPLPTEELPFNLDIDIPYSALGKTTKYHLLVRLEPIQH